MPARTMVVLKEGLKAEKGAERGRETRGTGGEQF